jgi:hypothetical protein
MFGIFDDYGMFYNHVYYSDSPLGPWTGTPNNCYGENHRFPKCKDNKPHKSMQVRHLIGLRNGGMPIIHDGVLYRAVQRTKQAYGDALDLYEVRELTKTDIMIEELDTRFRKNFRKNGNVERWNSHRFHHIDLHRLDTGKGGSPFFVAAVDGDKEGLKELPKNLTVIQNSCRISK